MGWPLDQQFSAEQKDWLAQELAANSSRNIVIFNHCPYLTYTGTPPPNWMMEDARNLLLAYAAHGVRHVFTGHNHYDRFVEFDGLGGLRHLILEPSAPHILHVKGNTLTYGKRENDAFVEYPASLYRHLSEPVLADATPPGAGSTFLLAPRPGGGRLRGLPAAGGRRGGAGGCGWLLAAGGPFPFGEPGEHPRAGSRRRRGGPHRMRGVGRGPAGGESGFRSSPPRLDGGITSR